MLLVSVAVGAFNVGMGPRAEVAHRAPRVVAVEPSAAIDMASLDPTVLGGAAAVVLGGAALAFSNKGDSAPAPAPAPPAPAPAPSPVVSTPVVYVPVGGTAGPHRMAGTMPPPPVRELWTPPPGWKPPTPPVSSWVSSAGSRTQPFERRSFRAPTAYTRATSSRCAAATPVRLGQAPDPAARSYAAAAGNAAEACFHVRRHDEGLQRLCGRPPGGAGCATDSVAGDGRQG
eukprot:5906993-Prymnesium_polylepis.1